MKRNILFLLSLCMLLLTCSDGNDPIKEIEKPNVETKDPFITLKKTNIDFINEGGSEAISIESNVSWTAKSSASWCTVSPSSGNKSTASITLSAPANEDYDNRSCTVTITGGSLSKTITVNQGENVGLLVTQDRYELSNEESTIKVEVKANVEFEVEINDKWITKVETRGLSTSQIEFKIAENETYVNRDGSITIKQKGGNLTSTISIFQSQKDAIILSDKTFDLSPEKQAIEVELKTNVEFEVIIPEAAKSWVSYTPTRGLRTENLTLNISENKDYTARNTEVYVKNKKTNLQDTLSINQAANTGLIISENKYEVSNDGGIIEIEVKANVEFDIEIADNWITQVITRGLTTTKLQFQVAKNKTYDNREGSITFKQKGGNLSSTIKVYQTQENAIILSEKEFELTSDAQSVELEIKTNIDYEIIIPEAAKSWVSYIETRALRTETVVLDIAHNNNGERSVKVIVKNKNTDLQEIVTIKQTANIGLIVSDKRYELSNEGGPIELEIKTNIDYEIIIPEAAKNWVSYIETRGAYREETVVLYIDENKSEKMRSTNVYIKGKSTDLQETISIYQIGNVPGVYWVDKMGALGTFLNKTQKDTITTMIIKGEINRADFDVMKIQMPKLRYLDLKEVKCEGDKIPDYAFGGQSGANKNINTIILPESITVIGYGAFEGCSGLTGNLVIPDEVITIGDRAFDNCSGFTGNLILPDRVITIGDRAFDNCSGFTGNLVFPDRVKTIGNRAFYGCSGFTGDLILPDEVATIGEYAFYGCLGFTGNLYLPDGITTIERGAFQLCRGFTGDLNIPDKVITIERSAFYYCTGLTTLTIGKNVTTIYESAFKDCWSITGNVVFPASLTSVRASGFEECNNVDAFRFPHTTPIAYYPKMFKDDATVEVPISAVNTYKSTNGWKDYNILGYIPLDGDLPVFE